MVNLVLIAVTASVDAYFLRGFGPSVLAGLALAFPLLMLMQQVANSSMGGAIASAMARAIGAGRRDHASALVVHAIVIAVGMAAISTTLILVAGPTFYRLMGGQGPTLAAAVEYSNVIFAGALAYWVLSTLTSLIRGAGQAAVLGVVYVAAEIVHVLLVPVLVFGAGPVPALGITGAGVATVASFSLSAVALHARRQARQRTCGPPSRWPGISRQGERPSRCRSGTSVSTDGCSWRSCAWVLRCRSSRSSTTSRLPCSRDSWGH